MLDADDVKRLRAVYHDRYTAWLAARERQDAALKAYHQAFNVLIEAEVAAARQAALNDGLVVGNRNPSPRHQVAHEPPDQTLSAADGPRPDDLPHDPSMPPAGELIDGGVAP